MKKLLAIVAATAALFTFTPTEAKAGHSYQSRTVGTCQHCRGRIYSYYRPVRTFQGRTQFGWVTASHTRCAASFAQRQHQARFFSSRSFVNPRFGRSAFGHSRFGHSRFGSRSFVRPGISFSFGGGRGFCR